MTPQPAPAQTPQSRGWSPARRAAQAEAIRRWRPWAKSTGPKTAAGKARVAQNAAKASARSRLPDPDRRMKRALKNHEAYLTDLNRFILACKKFPKNKLLKECKKHFYKRGLKTRQDIIDALLYAKLCKNLAFAPSIPIKVNANDG